MRRPGGSAGDRRATSGNLISHRTMEKVVEATKGKPVVLVLLSGSALAVSWADLLAERERVAALL